MISNQRRPNSFEAYSSHSTSQIWQLKMRVGCSGAHSLGPGSNVFPLQVAQAGSGSAQEKGNCVWRVRANALLCFPPCQPSCWVRREREETMRCALAFIFSESFTSINVAHQYPWPCSLLLIYHDWFLEEGVGMGLRDRQALLSLVADIQDAKTSSAFGELPFLNILKLLILCYNEILYI